MEALLSSALGPLLIFFLRVTDVSMAVVRMILAVRGRRLSATFIGFFEVLIWLFAAGTALSHLDSWTHVVAYAAGFATGNFVGISIEQRLALGLNAVRAVLRTRGPEVAASMREEGFAVTMLAGQGKGGSLDILNLIVPRSKVDVVLKHLHEFAPEAFVSVEEVRSMHGGYVRPAGRKSPWLIR